jgi:hypothetical protein
MTDIQGFIAAAITGEFPQAKPRKSDSISDTEKAMRPRTQVAISIDRNDSSPKSLTQSIHTLPGDGRINGIAAILAATAQSAINTPVDKRPMKNFFVGLI